MSACLNREQLQELFGGCCSLPNASTKGAQEISIGPEVFERLIAYWKGLPHDSRPRLKGLSFSREVSGLGGLQLILTGAGGGASVLISVGMAPLYQSLQEVWPYAVWWENELACFEGLKIPARKDHGGVAWLQS